MSPVHIVWKNTEFFPLTLERWQDFLAVMGKHGAYGGCWCMYWRITRREFSQQQGRENRLAMKRIVESGEIPGIIAYREGEPVGWCSIAPRERFSSLERSRVLKRIDNQNVWSLVCLYVPRKWQGKRLGETLIYGAIEYVKKRGGKIIEAYPTVTKSDPLAPVSVYMGTPKMFLGAGFIEQMRASKSKLIMRYFIS